MRSTSSTTLVTAVSALLLLVLVVLDMVTPPDTVTLAPLFALAPLVACAVLSPRRTALVAAAAVVAVFGSGAWNDASTPAQFVVRIINVVTISFAAVIIASVRVRQARRVGRLTVLAEVAQRAILPVVPEHARQTDIAVRYASATKDTVVGGDLYDCYHSRSHTRFLIGDVRGKGIGAVEHAARVIRAFRQAAAIQTELHTVASDMSSYLFPFFDEEEFVTALLLDTTDVGRPVLVNAGHPAPLLVRADGSYEFLEREADLPLGLGHEFSSHTFEWEPGDRLLLYTDGVSEARDVRGDFLALEELAPLLRSSSLDRTLDQLLERLRAHSARGALGDDVAVMLLEHTSHGQEYRSTVGDHDWLALLPGASAEHQPLAAPSATTVANGTTDTDHTSSMADAQAAVPAPRSGTRTTARV